MTDWEKALFDHNIADGKSDELRATERQANSYEKFSLSSREKVEGLMIERMDRNHDIVSKFLNEDDFKGAVFEHVGAVLAAFFC